MHFYINRHNDSLREASASLRFSDRIALRWEWNLFRGGLCGISFYVDGGESRVNFGLKIPWLIFIWFHVEWPWLVELLGCGYEAAKKREMRAHAKAIIDGKDPYDVVPTCYDDDREISISLHDKAIWWKLWWRTGYSSRRDPKWRDGCWHYLDTLLGKEKYSCISSPATQVAIPLPEGSYIADVKVERSTWKRPLWPWAKKRLSYHVDFTKARGVPVPGKGENSWDCGPDAIQSLSVSADSLEEAIGETVKRVLKNRVRYGGAHDYAERNA